MLNVICRVMMFGEWNGSFPPEMIHHILWFLPPHESISEKEKKRVMKHASDMSTIGGEKEMFLECVFGKEINIILKELGRL